MDFTPIHPELDQLEKVLGYHFADKSVLQLACIHRSYYNENHETVDAHNERLEFIGDAALDLLISDFLYKEYPDVSEGELSSLRSTLVQAKMCTVYTQKIGLEKFLLLGKGEERNEGRARERLMANFFEALIGALYFDGGMPAVSKFYYTHFQEILDETLQNPEMNWKAVLQDYAQREHRLQPEYVVVEESGPDHDKKFTIKVMIGTEQWGTGIGNAKKEAEILAARSACRNRGIKG